MAAVGLEVAALAREALWLVCQDWKSTRGSSLQVPGAASEAAQLAWPAAAAWTGSAASDGQGQLDRDWMLPQARHAWIPQVARRSFAVATRGWSLLAEHLALLQV